MCVCVCVCVYKYVVEKFISVTNEDHRDLNIFAVTTY